MNQRDLAEKRLSDLLVKRFGEAVIKKSGNNRDAGSHLSVHKDTLVKSFTDNGIHVYAEKHWCDEFVKLSKFVDYITNHANTNNTKGKFQEYMDLSLIHI